jgi:D-alanyl-D-alanine carboxypeptidase (penicillin-binding protein 5/6)
MSATKPPILTPGTGPRRNYERRRRRVPAGALGAAVVLCVAVAALIASGAASNLLASGHGERRSTAIAASQPRDAHAPAPQRLSPLGLPLAAPALELHGLGGADDPVRASFRPAPRAGILVNLDSGRVLWQLHPLRRVPIASLTKMMTALMVAETTPRSARVLITKEARDAQGSKVGVLPLGRRIPVETMMYGLMLPSGNDAAVALAEHTAGTVRRFVREMNTEAALRGLGCSEFSSPSGLVDADNFSCPADLAVLAHDDLAQPRIARITRTASTVLPLPVKGGKLFLYNNNPILIYGYPGATGLKTGYTNAAGKCLVATAERHGVRLGVVLLDAPQPGTEAQRLLDEGFEGVYHVPPRREPPIPGGV